MYDIIVIGAGPAGISAAIYALSRGKKTLVIEKNQIGGLIGKVSTVTHYTGLVENETGKTFSERLKTQAKNVRMDIVYEEVKSAELNGDTKKITTDKNEYSCSKIIITSGTTPRMLNIPGEAELTGKGMRMNAPNDGNKYKGKNVYVVGGADGAIKEALYLAGLAKKVTIIHFEDTLGCIPEFKKKVEAADNIEVKTSSRLYAVHGSEQIESIEIADVHTEQIYKIDDSGCGIFVYAGATPNTDIYDGIELDSEGCIKTDDNMMTNIKGVYAAGDIRSKQVKQVATAIADGAVAAINAAK